MYEGISTRRGVIHAVFRNGCTPCGLRAAWNFLRSADTVITCIRCVHNLMCPPGAERF